MNDSENVEQLEAKAQALWRELMAVEQEIKAATVDLQRKHDALLNAWHRANKIAEGAKAQAAERELAAKGASV